MTFSKHLMRGILPWLTSHRHPILNPKISENLWFKRVSKMFYTIGSIQDKSKNKIIPFVENLSF